jgi:tetratricopeptide (TPR) repeat protein
MTSARALVALLVVAFLAACSNPEKEKVEHVRKGDQYVADKKDDFAVIEYASAIKIDPKYGDAHWKLAQTYERINNLSGAFPEYVRAADALPGNRDAQIKATEVLFVGGQLEDAKARAMALVAKNPKDVEARLLQANAMAALRDTDGALSQVEEALKVSPEHGGAFVTLAAIRAQRGQLKEAEAAYRRAITLAPKAAGNRLALANFLLTARRAPEAESVLSDTLALEPQNLVANRMLAGLYLSTRRNKDAEVPLKIVARVSKDPAASFQLADYYANEGRTKDATDLLTELASKQATSAEAETRLAALEHSMNKVSEAHKRLDVLLSRVPSYAPALVMRARWLTTENKLDEALESAKAAVAANPQSSAAYATLAEVQNRRGQATDAVKWYTEVLRLDPNALGARAALSRLNLAAGQLEAAVRYGDEARRSEPQSIAARVALSRSLLATGNVARAEKEIADLVKGAPSVPAVHTLQGLLEGAKRNDPAARRAFEHALQLSPGFVEALSGLTALDLRANVPLRALARLEPEIAKQATNTALLALAARAYNAAGNQEKAEQTLRRAVSADPQFRVGYTMLAQLYIQQRRLDQARAEFEGMAKRDPAAVDVRTMVGVLFEAQGKRDEAKKWYEGTVSASDNAPIAANNLAYIYAEQSTNLDMALQLATSAKPKLPNDPDVDDTIGWVYYKKDLASLAVGPLEESLKRRPDNAEVLYHLGLTHAKLGNKDKARAALQRALVLDPSVGGGEAQRALAALSQ